MAWSCPLIFDPQGAFLHVHSVSLAPPRVRRGAGVGGWGAGMGGAGIGDPLILYSNKVLRLFVLAMTVILRQETKLGYLPCLCHCFHFREQTGG